MALKMILFVTLVFANTLSAAEAPRAWRRARGQVADAFARTLRDRASIPPDGDLDWRPVFRAIVRVQKNLLAPESPEYLAFVVRGGIEDGARRIGMTSPRAEDRANLVAQLENGPGRLLRNRLREIAWPAVAALGVNAVAGVVGVGAVMFDFFAAPGSMDQLFLSSLAGMGQVSVAAVAAAGIVYSEFVWRATRLKSHAASCVTALTAS